MVTGALRMDATVLQGAVARLLGYRWPAELDPDMELADEQREWIEKSKSLLPYADKDGIVCIQSVRGETSAVDRLLNLLAAAYGEEWSNDILAELLKQANHAGKTLSCSTAVRHRGPGTECHFVYIHNGPAKKERNW